MILLGSNSYTKHYSHDPQVTSLCKLPIQELSHIWEATFLISFCSAFEFSDFFWGYILC